MSAAIKPRKQASASAIDWAQIHTRLENANAVVERRMIVTSEEKQRVLKMRAKVLAGEAQVNRPLEQAVEVIEFLLAHETYGIESSYVREVCSLKELTSVPGAPLFVRGIMNVRGQIISLIDLKKFFDLPERALPDLNKVIIIADSRMEFGVLADAVRGTQRIPLPDIQPPLPTLTGIRKEYIRGLTRFGLVVVDAAKLLGDPKIVIRQETRSTDIL